MFAPNAGYGANIICTQGSLCKIICGVKDACGSSMIVHCAGKCIIQGTKDLGLPLVIYYNNTIVIAANTTGIDNGGGGGDDDEKGDDDKGDDDDDDDKGDDDEEDLNTGDSGMIDNESTEIIVLMLVFSILVIFLLLGYIDAKCIRKNELFRWPSVLFCAMYSLDFLSGTYV